MSIHKGNIQPDASVPPPPSRRRFIQWLSLGAVCAGSDLYELVSPAALASGSSSSVGLFRMNLDQYPVLKNDGGSVITKVTGMPTSFAQIIVTRLPNDEFAAVTSKCTHQGCPVDIYDPEPGLLQCPCHGSQFTAKGVVQHGPATRPLTPYAATFDGISVVTVQIPGLGFAVTIAPGTTNDRVQLQFPTVNGVKYDIRFRSSVAGVDWQTVPFSTTADGELTQTVLNGNNAQATVYVARNAETGFLAVSRF